MDQPLHRRSAADVSRVPQLAEQPELHAADVEGTHRGAGVQNDLILEIELALDRRTHDEAGSPPLRRVDELYAQPFVRVSHVLVPGIEQDLESAEAAGD